MDVGRVGEIACDDLGIRDRVDHGGLIFFLLPFRLVFGCSDVEPQRPPGHGPVPELMRVSPSTDKIPANALLFRLQFTEPMDVRHELRVLTADHREVVGAVSQVTAGVDERELQLALDGLLVGQDYAIRLSGLRSAHGVQLAERELQFQVTPRDISPPDGEAVGVVAGEKGPLMVVFPEAMRAESAGDLTVLVGARPLNGGWSWSEDQSVATFQPTDGWPVEPVALSIGAGPVDLAGNALINKPAGVLTPRRLSPERK